MSDCQCQTTGRPCASGAKGAHTCPTASRVKTWLASPAAASRKQCPKCQGPVTITSHTGYSADWKCSACGIDGFMVVDRQATAAATAPRSAQRPPVAAAPRPAQAAPAAPTPRADGPLSVGDMQVHGTPLMVTHAAGLEWFDPRVRVIETAVANVWRRLPDEARSRVEAHFRARGGLKLFIAEGLGSKDGLRVLGGTRPGGDFVFLAVEAAEAQMPREVERVFVHELAHALGETSEAGADAVAASWGWPREVC